MKALRVTMANRLETLADSLAAVVARPLGSPLARETIVVRNPGMERWVTLALARRLGIWANSVFPLPNAFLDQLFQDFIGEGPSEAWKPDVLAWRVQRLLPELIGRPELAPLRSYLEAEDATGLKRWQLAGRIADLLDQYLVYRPDWVEEWRKGRPAGRPGQHRDWQAILLRRLWAEEAGPDRAVVRQRFFQAVTRGDAPVATLPERVSVFGIAALPPFHLETLAALATRIEVNLFLLNPCREFWYESMTDRRFLRLQRGAGAQRELWDALPSTTGNGLLASLGALGREVFGLLLDVEPKEEHEAFTPAQGGSVLARLQRAILDDEPLPPQPSAADPRDGSLQVHNCHSPMREIEVLRDRLLALFQADPTLKPEDAVVMAPEIETYVPYIEAVFRQESAAFIPYNLSDRKLARSSSPARTFLSVLRLGRQRFAAPDVLDVLESEPVRLKLGLAEGDLSRIRQWVVESGIRWGIDADDRARLGLPARGENTWRFGLRRLLLGTALEGGRVFAGVLPLDAGTERETLAVFVDFAERLIEAAAMLTEPRLLSAWSDTLGTLLADLFGESAETETLQAEIRRLAECGRHSGYSDPVGLDVIASHLAQRLEAASPGLGFLTEGVTFCPLLPMRAIPFRVVCLLGMGFGAFPRADSPVGFDLMAADPRAGDRSRRNDDRYLFLETLLSARDVLYLSYVGRSANDGSAMAPAVVVSELLEDVRRRFAFGEDLPLQHPLHAWSPRYFDGSDERLYSYSREALAASREAVRAAGLPRRAFFGRGLGSPPADPAGIRLEDLVDFYRNPARALLRQRLEINLRESAVEVEAREPFEIAGLDRYRLANDLLDRCLRGEDLEETRMAMRGRGSLPHGTAGDVELARLEREVLGFVAAYAGELKPRRREPVALEVQAAGMRITGSVELWDGRLLRYRFAAARAFDRLGLWIRHLAACRAGVACGPSRLLASDRALSLAPAADTSPLDELVVGYLQGMDLPLAFFPETSLAYAEALRAGKGEDEALAKARQKWRPSEWDGGRGEADEPSIHQCFGDASSLEAAFCAMAVAVYRPMLEAEEGE